MMTRRDQHELCSGRRAGVVPPLGPPHISRERIVIFLKVEDDPKDMSILFAVLAHQRFRLPQRHLQWRTSPPSAHGLRHSVGFFLA